MNRQVTTRASSTAKPSVWTEPRQSLGGKSAMDHLFDRLDGMYVGRWRQQFTSPQQVENWTQTWAEAFETEGITPEEVKRGLDTCRRRHDWPPSLTEFLKACRPPIEPEVAYYEACQQMALRRNPVVRDGMRVTDDRWSHPAIYWAAVAMGPDINLGYDVVKKRWAYELQKAMENPAPVPEFREALPPPEKCALPIEESRKRIKDIASMLADGFSMPAKQRQLTERERDIERNNQANAIEELRQRMEGAEREQGGP